MDHPSVLQINLSAVEHNMRVFRRIVGSGPLLCPVLKADGYGLGARRLARPLAGAGASLFAVYTPDEAAEVCGAATDVPVLILMPVHRVDDVDDLYRALLCGRIHLTVHDSDHLDCLRLIAARFASRLDVHVEIDTGMVRGGSAPEEAAAVIRAVRAEPRLRLAGVFTHFAEATKSEERCEEQAGRLEAFIDAHADLVPDDCLVHVANTRATLRGPRFHKSMVRFGLGWVGYGEQGMTGAVDARAADLRPCFRWRSRIVLIKTIEVGERVGYGGRWAATRSTVGALIPVGYADGLPRALGSTEDRPEAPACVGVLDDDEETVLGHAPIIGAVSMDQVVIDVTDIVTSDAGRDVSVGTNVELISDDPEAPNSLTGIAEATGAIPYELMCRIHSRVTRVYRNDGAVPIVEVKGGVRHEVRATRD